MKIVILDRDGVINYDSDEYIKSPDEWHPIPGSAEAIALLNQAGYKVAVATNQSGLRRGYFDLNRLIAIHEKMENYLAQSGAHLDALYFCPHTPDDHCKCRKPEPGLLIQIGEYFKCDLAEAYFIGDSLRDAKAALAVNAKPIFVGHDPVASEFAKLNHIPFYSDLITAIKEIFHLSPSP